MLSNEAKSKMRETNKLADYLTLARERERERENIGSGEGVKSSEIVKNLQLI